MQLRALPVRVGMALYGDLTYDSRVRREAVTLLRAGYDVSIVCLAGDAPASDMPEGVRVLVRRPTSTRVLPGARSPFVGTGSGRIKAAARMVRWLVDYVRNLRAWGRMVVAAAGEVDIWHAHDLTALSAVAPLVSPGVPIVYDAHELFLETGTALRLARPLRSLLQRYERRLIARTSAVLTVNESLAAVLRERYQPARIEVVHNCPDRWSPPDPRPTLLRDSAGIPDRSLVILYHGALSAHRGIEQLMEALLQPGLEDAHLVLLGFGEKREDYVETATNGAWSSRVHVLDPVPPASLLRWVASADIGAMPIQASTLNHYLSTPNKLFECLAAGTPVVVSSFPAMASVVKGNEAGSVGAVCDPADVHDIAAAIRSIAELDPLAMTRLRSRCAMTAQQRWNWESESARLVSLYGDIAKDLPQVSRVQLC